MVDVMIVVYMVIALAGFMVGASRARPCRSNYGWCFLGGALCIFGGALKDPALMAASMFLGFFIILYAFARGGRDEY